MIEVAAGEVHMLRRANTYTIFEYACHEGNHAMTNILSASRAEDRQAAGEPPAPVR